MSCPNRPGPYLLRLAEPADSPAIGRVLEEGSFPGKIAVQFTRRPDPYASYLADGESLAMPLAVERATGEVAGVGGCVLRRAHVNGGVTVTGYLTGMKVLAAHQKRRIPMREAYRLIHDSTGNSCGLYVTTVLSDNRQALALLEKRHRGMPAYHFLGNYTVYCTGTGRRFPVPRGFRLVRGHDGAVATFYREQLPRYQLAPADEWLHGLGGDDFYSLRTESGAVVAAGALWNQQGYKQYTVTGYGALYRLLRRLPTGLLGYPTMPRAGQAANYLSMALPLVHQDHMALAGPFLRLLAGAAGRRDFLMLGLLDGHPLVPAAAGLPHIKYTSRLYAVAFGEEPLPSLEERPFLLEVGLL